MNPKSKNLVNAIIGVSVLISVVVMMRADFMIGTIGGVMAFVCGWIYFVPTITALNKDHENTTAIFALNFLLGWMLLPWIGALVWALSRNRTAELMQAVATAPAPLQPSAPLAASEDTRDCPMCAEPIKKAAVKCKHCGSEVSPTAT